MNHLFSNALKLGVATLAGAVVAGTVLEVKPAQAFTISGSFSEDIRLGSSFASFTGDFSLDTSSVVGNLVNGTDISFSNLVISYSSPSSNLTGWSFSLFNFVFNTSTNLFEGTYSINRYSVARPGQLGSINGQSWNGPSGQTVTFTSAPPTSAAVPEPFTILGSTAALGLGTLFKHRTAKKKAKAA